MKKNLIVSLGGPEFPKNEIKSAETEKKLSKKSKRTPTHRTEPVRSQYQGKCPYCSKAASFELD